MIEKEPADSGQVRVTFRLSSTIWADRIALVGSFNEWNTEANFFNQAGQNGEWLATVELEPLRRYQFRYLVDGNQWLNDDQADDFEPNPHGGFNSVIYT